MGANLFSQLGEACSLRRPTKTLSQKLHEGPYLWRTVSPRRRDRPKWIAFLLLKVVPHLHKSPVAECPRDCQFPEADDTQAFRGQPVEDI